jgi:Tfp pilus assembly protein PilF
MKLRLLLVVGLLLGTCLHATAQEDSVVVDSAFRAAMDRGLSFYDEGRYDLALLEFEQARAIDPKNGFLNYETALTHYQVENNGTAIKYAKKAAKEDSQHGVQGTILLGTIWDGRDKHKKAMRVFRKGIKRFGDYYLLNYNLGVAAFEAERYEDAFKAFQQAILKELDHADSHLGMARVSSARERMVEALYPLYFFMLLQPEHDLVPRLVERIGKFQKGLEQHSVEQKRKRKDKHKGYAWDDPLRTLNLQYRAFFMAKDLLAKEAEMDNEIVLLKTFFAEAGEVYFTPRNDLVTNYYVPFFAAIAKQGFMEPCYHYMHHKVYAASEAWMKDHYDEVEHFFQWLDAEAPKPNALD